MCRHSRTYLFRPLIVGILVQICPHTRTYLSSYSYVSVLILVYICPHTRIYLSSYSYRAPDTAIHVACVLITCVMCPHTGLRMLVCMSATEGCSRGYAVRTRGLRYMLHVCCETVALSEGLCKTLTKASLCEISSVLVRLCRMSISLRDSIASVLIRHKIASVLIRLGV